MQPESERKARARCPSPSSSSSSPVLFDCYPGQAQPYHRAILKIKKTTVVVAGLLIAATIVGFWLSKAPTEPVYEGKRLSEWLRIWGQNSDPRAEVAFRTLGTEAVPWLIWAAENGNEPEHSTAGAMPISSAPTWLDLFKAWLSKRGTGRTDNFNEREYARRALFLIGQDRDDVDEFAKYLTRDPKAGVDAARFLVRKGGAPQDYVLRFSEEGTDTQRLNAVKGFEALLYNGSAEERKQFYAKVVPALVRALRDPNPKVPASAGITYGNTPNLEARQDSHAEALPILIGLLSDPTWQVRDGAGWALYTMGSAASSAVLKAIPLLSDPESFVRQRIARALGRIDKKEQLSRDALLKMANTPGDFNCQVAAAQALGEFGIRANLVDELIAQLESPEAIKRGEAMCGLVDTGPIAADSMPMILKAMEKEAGSPANYSTLI